MREPTADQRTAGAGAARAGFAARAAALSGEHGAAVAAALLGFALFLAYHPLLGYDPESPHPTLGGTEGLLFEPTGGSPQLILAVSAWMVWNRRRQFAGALGQPASASCLAALIGSLALALWAKYTGAIDLLIPSLSLCLLGGAGLVAGRPGVRSMRLPALFLLFAVPLPPAFVNFIIYPLQLFTAKSTLAILSLLQVEALREGDMIHTPVKIFHVIETCGGMRVMVTLTFSAVIYAELFRRSNLGMLLLSIAAPFVAASVNVARVLTIVLNPYSDLAPVHTAQGVAMVILSVLILACVDRALLAALGERANAPPRRRLRRRPDNLSQSLPRLAALGTFLLLLSGSIRVAPVWQPPVEIRPPTIYEVPTTLGGWQAGALTVDERFLGSVAFTERLARVYVRGTEHVDLFLGLDRRLEREGSMLSDKTMVPSSGWELREHGEFRLVDGQPATLGVVESRSRNALVVRWYEGALSVAAESVRSLLALDHSPFKRPGYTLVVRAATPIAPGSNGRLEAMARLEEFIALLQPALAKIDVPSNSVR